MTKSAQVVDKQGDKGNRGGERMPWVDWAKAFCMFCVVLTHTKCFTPRIMLNYFDMPAFMMISGFLYKNVPFKDEIKKSFRGILVPYLLFNTILLIAATIIGDFEWRMIVNILLGNQEGIIAEYFHPLWFLVSIFIIRIICSLCRESIFIWLTLFFIALSIVVSKIAPYDVDYFQLCTTTLCFPFFLGGRLLRKYKGLDYPNMIAPVIRYSILSVITILLVILMYRNGGANIFRCSTGNSVLLYYVICFFFSFIILYLISKICTKSSNVILNISTGTVLILGLQYLFIKGLIYGLPCNRYVAFGVAVAVMMICYPLILLSKRYFHILLGGRGTPIKKI